MVGIFRIGTLLDLAIDKEQPVIITATLPVPETNGEEWKDVRIFAGTVSEVPKLFRCFFAGEIWMSKNGVLYIDWDKYIE